MKTILLLFTLLFAVSINAQNDTSKIKWIAYSPSVKSEPIKDGYIPYLIGSNEIPGYKLETRTCSKEESMTLSNGRRVAGISCILFDKNDYVGGNMIFEDDTTIITNITVIPDGDGAIFTVSGNEFNMSFTLISGSILKYEDGCVTFNTDKKGVWAIYKKV